jgi:hypothetical protein
MNSKWLAVLILAGSGAGVTGCGGGARDTDSLDQTIHVYNENVRWERYDKAAVLLPPRQRADAIDAWDQRAHDLKITDWEIIRMTPHGDGEIHAQIKLSWYKPSEEIVRVTDEIQTWHKTGRNWLLVEESRLRGDEMPGLSEPSHVHAAVPKREGTR